MHMVSDRASLVGFSKNGTETSLASCGLEEKGLDRVP
jgi:hypothetical protein